MNGCGRRAGSGRTCIGRCGVVARVLSHSLTELCQLTSELGELMLGVWIGCTGRNPAVDEIRDLLSGKLGVVGLIQQFAILPSPAVRDLVQIDSFVSELRQEFRGEHHCCYVSSRDQIEFTTMSQLAKPEVVGLLIQ